MSSSRAGGDSLRWVLQAGNHHTHSLKGHSSLRQKRSPMMIVRSRQCLPLQSDPEGAARRYVVAFMALVGISTALLVNMLGQARIWTMAAREHLIPLFWARVSQRFGTPIAAQVTMGAASGQWRLIAFFMALQQAGGSSSLHFACC